jgi:hypothetical protein
MLHNFTYTEALALHAINRAWQEHSMSCLDRGQINHVLDSAGKEVISAVTDCLVTFGWGS